MPNDALLRGDLKQARYIKQAEPLNVDRSALIVNAVVAVGVHLLNCRTFCVLVGFNNIVDTLFGSPITKVLEHYLHFLQVELAGAAKSQNVVIIEVEFIEVGDTCSQDPFFELGRNLVLFRASIAHET